TARKKCVTVGPCSEAAITTMLRCGPAARALDAAEPRMPRMPSRMYNRNRRATRESEGVWLLRVRHRLQLLPGGLHTVDFGLDVERAAFALVRQGSLRLAENSDQLVRRKRHLFTGEVHTGLDLELAGIGCDHRHPRVVFQPELIGGLTLHGDTDCHGDPGLLGFDDVDDGLTEGIATDGALFAFANGANELPFFLDDARTRSTFQHPLERLIGVVVLPASGWACAWGLGCDGGAGQIGSAS